MPQVDDYDATDIDQITPNVALARADDGGGIYNSMALIDWSGDTDDGIYWKLGPTVEAGNYINCLTCDSGTGSYLGNGGVVSLWLPEGNLFFDLSFTSWTSGGQWR